MTETQLNLFERDDPLWIEYRSLEIKQDNLRRGLFKRLGLLKEEVLELRLEIAAMKGLSTNKTVSFSEMDLFREAK